MKTENIPEVYAKHGNTAEAYRRGFNHGHGIACHNVPTLGAKIFSGSLGRVTVDADNIREVHESVCFEAESNSRQYSPFEFTAHEFNRADDDCAEMTIASETDDMGTARICIVDKAGEVLKSGFATQKAAQAWIDALPCSDKLWEAFDAGIADAIRADLAGYTDADYGIAEDTEETLGENLDAFVDSADLNGHIAELLAKFPSGPDYDSVIPATYLAYAKRKARAMDCRMSGLIEEARVNEAACDAIFKTIPAGWRW